MRIAALNLTQKEEDDEEEVVEQKGRRAVETLVERFDIEPYSDFSAK